MSDDIYDKDSATPEQWKALATKQLKCKSPDDLTWETAEDIDVRPLYTAADTEDEYGNQNEESSGIQRIRHGASLNRDEVRMIARTWPPVHAVPRPSTRLVVPVSNHEPYRGRARFRPISRIPLTLTRPMFGSITGVFRRSHAYYVPYCRLRTCRGMTQKGVPYRCQALGP